MVVDGCECTLGHYVSDFLECNRHVSLANVHTDVEPLESRVVRQIPMAMSMQHPRASVHPVPARDRVVAQHDPLRLDCDRIVVADPNESISASFQHRVSVVIPADQIELARQS